MSELLERLQKHKIPVVEISNGDNGFDADFNILSDRLTSLQEAKPTQEKILAEIFFCLAMGLSEMSRLYIAHLNLRAENIFLDENLKPYFSDFSACNKFAQPEHFLQDLMGLSKVMQSVIASLVNTGELNWVRHISESSQLMDLRSNLYLLAERGSRGEIATIDQLINSLIHIYPELVQGDHQYFSPPARLLAELPIYDSISS